MTRKLPFLAGAALVCAAALVPVQRAEAQYFGQNKVQYESLDFEVLKTEHFDIYFYPEEEVAVEYAALMAERWYARLSRLLNHDLRNHDAYCSKVEISVPNASREQAIEGAEKLYDRVLPILIENHWQDLAAAEREARRSDGPGGA